MPASVPGAVNRQSAEGDTPIIERNEHHGRTFQVALKNAPVTVFNQDRALRYTWVWNPTFDLKPYQVVGKTDEQLFTPEDAAVLTAVKRHVLETGHRTRLSVKMGMRTAQPHTFELTIRPLRDPDNRIVGIVCTAMDITQLWKANEQLAARARQQAAVADLGRMALAGADLQQLMDQTCRLTARTLNNEFVKILEYLPADKEFVLRAGIGWRPGLVGDARVEAGRDSQAGYTLVSDHPVITNDLRHEHRFYGPPLLTEHGVVAGISVIIAGPTPGGPHYGVLGTHTRRPRTFTDDDVNFIQAVANVLAAAIYRKNTERTLRAANTSLEKRVARRTEQLRKLTTELTQAEKRERRRLAQRLHDDLQQLLAVAKIRVGVLSTRLNEPQLIDELHQIDELLGQTVDISRSLTMELSPPALYDEGFNAGLAWLGRWMDQAHGLKVHLKIDENAEPVDEELRTLLFEAVRELLFNVIKHARVNEASVTTRRAGDDRMQVIVRDRGVGFEPQAANPAKSSFGIFSVRERLDPYGGSMTIHSRPRQGSRITLDAPLRCRSNTDAPGQTIIGPTPSRRHAG